MQQNNWGRLVAAIVSASTAWVQADWQPGDGHKMHYPQRPDEEGWDVNATLPSFLADDWQCSETGPVRDIHFWGSWRDMDGDQVGDVGVIQSFIIGIYADIPVDQSPTGFSMPGVPLREWEITAFTAVPIDPPTLEAWYDPTIAPELVIPNDHREYFQYDIVNLQRLVPDPFVQVQGTVYWLSITANVIAPMNTQWGWKSSRDHWNDDAVWSLGAGGADWMELYEPPRYNEFHAQLDPLGMFLGGGTNYFGQGWYFYPDTGWWNIWFYDNPFSMQNFKQATVEFNVIPLDPLLPSFLILAINWSTPEWSLQGNPPLDPRQPPLPGVDEALYIGRQILWDGPIPPLGMLVEEFWQLPYNPEWVSIDVMGENLNIVDGGITHECVRTSLDLAFVITNNCPCTGDVNGDGRSDAIDIAIFVNCFGQLPIGVCAGSDMNCDGVIDMRDFAILHCHFHRGATSDPYCCQANVGACCFTDGRCRELTAADCQAQGGAYRGDGSGCQSFQPQACCLPGGGCVMVDPTCCDGTPLGNGTVCVQVETGQCSDGVDNDCDRCIDGSDADCGGVETSCVDGVDNDCDGQTDCADPDCPLASTEQDCADGLDDDCNGCIDGADVDCGGTELLCSDGVDNDCDGNVDGADSDCAMACCLPDGRCVVTDHGKCVALGGDPQGPNSICPMPPDRCDPIKWVQPPTYGPVATQQSPCFWGWDEPSDYACCQIAADDWACDTDQPITDIHWWGSYQFWPGRVAPPIGAPGFPDAFHIGIWSDVPRDVDLPFSHPGTMLWQWIVPRAATGERWVGCDQVPGTPRDECFRYDFDIPNAEWFYQQPSTDPTIYWVSISAWYTTSPPQQPFVWGWKTREHFFNDGAVRILAPNMPTPGMEFAAGMPIQNAAADVWDMAFVLTTRTPGPSKWDQWPNPDLPGLHAHDGITLADNWECQGGAVTDLHWWGNYELDPFGLERRGAGIDCINLSLHANSPVGPWCLPQEPALWGVCAFFSALNEHDTGLINSEGAKIYEYKFLLEPGFAQLAGEIYWLDIEARSGNLQDPALWRWQENSRDAAPRLCPAAQKAQPQPQVWQSIVWPDDPPRFSEMAFRITSTPYPPHPDPSGINKNRHISLAVQNGGAPTALRVASVDLQTPQPPNSPCCPPKDFSAYEYGPTCTDPAGCVRWVGPARMFLEAQDNSALGNYKVARLQCTPYYHDWALEGLVHVTGAEILPSSSYDVTNYSSVCAGNEDVCAAVSPPLRVKTARWGDVAAPFNPPPGTVQPDPRDVVAMVDKFKNQLNAPVKAIAQLQPNLVDSNVDIGALDIVACLDAYQGTAYPYSGPCRCPSPVTCNATACSSPSVCSGGMCVKTCVGGTNAGLPCLNNNHCPGGSCPTDGFCRDRCGRCRD